jgi:ATP adenylyltransferase
MPEPRPEGPADEVPADRATALHAPWREAWIREIAARERAARASSAGDGASGRATEADSFLRRYWLEPERDAANRVIVRTGVEGDGDGSGATGGMVLLNAYPYCGGHLLVALGDGRPRLTDYGPEQRRAFWELVDLASALCERALEPQGLNIGVNVGRAGGAGVPTHLHAHVIPRWIGDTNFLSAVGQVRMVNASLDRFYEVYREAWSELGGSGSGGSG